MFQRNKAQKLAANLAVRYHAYHEARAAEDHNGIICWGPMLIEAQEALGMAEKGTALADPATIRETVALSRAALGR